MTRVPAFDRTATAQAEINVTPLIDVMLALVVVFMIAAPLIAHRIALPISGGPPSASPVEPVRLGIAADGALSWNGAALPAALLREQLRITAAREPQPELRIDVAPTAAYERLASALADAKTAHIGAIAVETSRDP